MSIAVKNLTYSYDNGHGHSHGGAGDTPALRDVSFSIAAGEFVGVMGHTGSGKSTLLALLAGLLAPTGGVVELDGRDIHARGFDRSELRRRVGVVFQYPETQLFETTVERDVAFGLRHAGLGAAEVARRVRRALELCGFDFERIRAAAPTGLSGGEKRRVAIAGILAAEPELLILDEPIAGLDPLGREDFLRLVTRLNREGMTILMISHNADALGEAARRILLLDGGRLVGDGTPEEIFEDAARMRRLHLGVPAARELSLLLQAGGLSLPPRVCSYRELLPAVLGAVRGGRA